MFSTSRISAIAAAAFISFSAISVVPAAAETAAQKDDAAIDRIVTGSVGGQACLQDDRAPSFACRLLQSDPDQRYPSAPVNPSFGF